MATLDSTNVPDDGGLGQELEEDTLQLPPRRSVPRLTLLLVAAVLAAGMFVAGAAAQKHWGGTSTSGARAGAGAFAARLGATTTGTGATTTTGTGTTTTDRGARGGFGGFAGGGATVGTVSVIKGSTLYVTDTSGNTVKVTTSPASAVTKSVSTTVKGINPGDTVVVRGTQQKNGTISAESITLGGTSGFGGGATGFGDGSGGATGFGGGGNGSGNGNGAGTGFGGGG